MSPESLVIYSMNRVGRIAQSAPNKQILRDISLGFYYGAKTPALHRTQCGASVGVLGLNGAGKRQQ